MVSLKYLAVLFLFTGCQIGHLIHVSYNHLSILNSAEPIENVLKNPNLTVEQINKIKLTQEVRTYAFNKLGLTKSKSYSKFVQLDRPYIVYNVTASDKWKFSPYQWHFPIVGDAPYIGFYNKQKADEEAEKLKLQNLDTSIRGVAAYSTLGYLADPLLSSMLNYSEYDLTNTIIHELVHGTVFFKDNVNFNEKLAVFIANKGSEMFYLEKEGVSSKTLLEVKNSNDDDAEFSKFITQELTDLKKWYADFDHSKKLPEDEKEALRLERLNQISIHFEKNLKPKLKTKSYNKIFSKKLNNADLIDFNTYMTNLDVFENAYKKLGSDILKFLDKCKELENRNNPEEVLQNL